MKMTRSRPRFAGGSHSRASEGEHALDRLFNRGTRFAEIFGKKRLVSIASAKYGRRQCDCLLPLVDSVVVSCASFSGRIGRFPGCFFPGGVFRVGKTSAGGAHGVPRSFIPGGDVRPARAEGKRDPSFADVQVQPGEYPYPFVETQSHENTCFFLCCR